MSLITVPHSPTFIIAKQALEIRRFSRAINISRKISDLLFILSSICLISEIILATRRRPTELFYFGSLSLLSIIHRMALIKVVKNLNSQAHKQDQLVLHHLFSKIYKN